MTEAMDRLIEAVEAGNDWISPLADRAFTDKQHAVWACKAFGHEGQPGTSGSLDATLALHQALLPGWEWARLNDRMAVEHGGSVYSHRGACPARAWLLAILKAYRAQIGGEG